MITSKQTPSVPTEHPCANHDNGSDVIMVGTWMLCGNGRSLSGRYHGRHMDALWERTEFVWTLSWSAHGCSVGTDGVCLDVVMVGTWMLCGNGRSWSGRYHGWHRDALWERTDVVWTLSWSAHGCSVGTDGVGLDVIMVGTWMLWLCGNGRSLSGRYHGWHMDALWERTEFVWTLSWSAHGCSVGTDGVCLDVVMVGTWMFCGIGRSLSGRYHGWHMDALWERTELVWTLSWLAHGCSVGTDGVCLDVIMVGIWILCGNRRSWSGRYHGWHMDALWEQTEFVWTLSWLAHGCSVGTDGVCLDVIMVGTWMLRGNGRSWFGRYHGWHMDALWERTDVVWTLSWLAHGCSVGTDGRCLDVIMVGTWMLCGNGRSLSGRYHGWHMDALWERTESVWTLSWLAYGCSVGTDGRCLDVIMVGTWMLCGNGRSLSGRYHGRHMDALWERTEFVWTLSWLAHGCSVGTDGVCLDVIMAGTWMLCGNGRSLSGRYHGWHMDALCERTELVWNVIMVGTWMLCGNGRTLSGRYHGWHMDALWERTGSVGTDGVCLDVIMVGTWMLCGNGRSLSGRYHGRHMDALWERTEFVWNIIMVGTWMLCGNGRSWSGRYHGWHMDALALWERTEFVWTLSWLAHGCSVGADGVGLDVIMVCTWMLCGNGRSWSGRYHGWHMEALALWERTEFVWTLSWLAHGGSGSVGTDGVWMELGLMGCPGFYNQNFLSPWTPRLEPWTDAAPRILKSELPITPELRGWSLALIPDLCSFL